MDALVEFLTARLAEDEAAARAALGTAAFQQQTGRWVFEKVRDQYGEIPTVFAVADGGGKTQAASLEAAWEGEERGAHIARHDPDRVLREVEAKRQQIRHLIGFMENDYAPWNETQLKIMAAVYSDHPDYREEWRP